MAVASAVQQIGVASKFARHEAMDDKLRAVVGLLLVCLVQNHRGPRRFESTSWYRKNAILIKRLGEKWKSAKPIHGD
jgi:hypothetical protein